MNEQKKKCRLFSTDPQHDNQSGTYSLSRKQRKAIRLTNEDSDANPADMLAIRLAEMKEEATFQDIEHDERNPLPWHNLLVYPSRALWRSSPIPPPPYILETQAKIIKASERTPKQLRRTNDRIVANHLSLSDLRERERRKMVNGSGHSGSSIAAKKQGGRDGSINPVFYSPEHSICSLKYRLVPNYSITRRILAETQSLLGKEVFQPKRILDVGIGAGSASAAALDFLNEQKSESKDGGTYKGVEWLHGIDPSQSMRDASNIMLSTVLERQTLTPNRRPTTRLTFGNSIVSTGRDDAAKSGGTFDLALCSYTLHEVPSVAASLSLSAIVWEKLEPGGVAIFIEPGTPDGFNALRSIRSMLLDVCPPDNKENVDGEEECHIIAPCTHHGTCPMVRHQKNFFRKKINEEDVDDEDDDTEADEYEEIDLDNEDDKHFSAEETDVFDTAFCSFVHGMPGNTRRKQGEKFSYLVVQKRLTDSSGQLADYEANNPFSETNIVDLLKQSLAAGKDTKRKIGQESKSFLDSAREIEEKFLNTEDDRLGLELVRGNNRKSFGRIVRAPIKKKGHVILDYCGSTPDDEGVETGRIVRSKVTRSQSSKGAPGMYPSSRKARWGGFWPDLTKD
jgi:ribosomal protein RSM22 (predicted rRNA methylase)